MVKIGHASIDEDGHIAGGDMGDQTGKEICIRDWYRHKHPWNVYLECTNEALTDAAADYMEEICADDNFGYDQNERITGYTSIFKNGRKVNGAKGEFDCSSLVCACYRLAGLADLNVTNTTRSLRKALLSTGVFVEYTDSSHLMSGKESKRGGVYLSEGHHVVMVISNDLTDKPKVEIHIVKAGETLSKIAEFYHVSVADLTKWNRIKNPNIIGIGQKIKVNLK